MPLWHQITCFTDSVILSVFYVCATWPLGVREENTLRMFNNRMLRTIFGPKRDEATGG